MLIPVKHSVAVMIFNGDKVLSVRRPDDDDELPGVWGLPAGTLRPSETIKDLIGRIGRDKLGVDLTLVRKVASGRQMRRLYLLQMELWEAFMAGSPFSLRLRPTGLALRGHPNWRWAAIDRSEEHTSELQSLTNLVCRLLLEKKKKNQTD